MAHGFSAATTDMIQQAAGVSKSTVYAHYPNKEVLFLAVVKAECESFLSTLGKPSPGRNLAEVLKGIAHAYLDRLMSPGGLALFRMIVAEAQRFPEVGRRFYEAGPEVINRIVEEALAAAEARGELDLAGMRREAAASLFVNMVRGEAHMQSLMHVQGAMSAAQRELWASDAVTAFLRAFQKNGSVRR
jgi:AcrR family transcriptional regulator